MSETQEIDALLISALYGELTPAQESALEAHLVSHPADKSALAALTSTRDAVRASRILQVHLDPPQQISALLLQEAARRAPKPEKQEGWFARLARSFMIHPAMAAAAMLVVVIGTVTLVQNRKGDQFAETAPARSVATEPANEQGMATQPAPAPLEEKPADERERDAPASNSASAAGSAAPASGADGDRFGGKDEFRVSLAAGDEGDGGRQPGSAEKKKASPAKVAKQEPSADETVAKNVASGKKAPAGAYMELRSPEPSVKDLEDSASPGFEAGRGYAQAPADVDRKENVNAVTPGQSVKGTSGPAATPVPPGNAAPSTKAGVAQAGPTPVAKAGEAQSSDRRDAAAPRNVAPPAAPPPPPKVAPVGAKTVAPAEDKANDPQLAWAREQHTAIIARVRNGDCKGAAEIAVGLANRDLAYYRQNVASDRSVKDCLAYIDNARERDQEQRAERNKKRTTNEPAKAADTVNSK